MNTSVGHIVIFPENFIMYPRTLLTDPPAKPNFKGLIMSEVDEIMKQIALLKGKLKAAKSKDLAVRRAKVLKLLEDEGVLDMDDAQILALVKVVKKSAKPSNFTTDVAPGDAAK